jgi:hypothetical protein
MSALSLVDYGKIPARTSGNLEVLTQVLAGLIGQPLRFARVAYGDELTLHFGPTRPAASPKLKGREYGAFILGVMGSGWVLSSQATGRLVGTIPLVPPPPESESQSYGKADFEADPITRPGSRVIACGVWETNSPSGISLDLKFSDGSKLTIMPTDDLSPDDGLLVPDWELLTPQGTLQVGPGMDWGFEATRPSNRSRVPVGGVASPKPAN